MAEFDPRRVTNEQAQPFQRLRSQPIETAVLTTSAAIIHTAPERFDFLIRHIWAANLDTEAQTITIYLVPDGDTPSDSNAICKEFAIDPSTTVRLGFISPDSGFGVLLQPLMTLQALCSTASVVNVGGWGHEVAGGI